MPRFLRLLLAFAARLYIGGYRVGVPTVLLWLSLMIAGNAIMPDRVNGSWIVMASIVIALTYCVFACRREVRRMRSMRMIHRSKTDA